MHPSWIGLLLAAVRSFSGHIPKSVVFREWFLSFPRNYTLSWLMSWSILPPPARAETSLFPALFIFPGTIREERMARGGQPWTAPHWNKCSGILHSTVPVRPAIPLSIPKAAHTGQHHLKYWKLTAGNQLLFPGCSQTTPTTPQCPPAQIYFSQAWSPNHPHPWSPLKVNTSNLWPPTFHQSHSPQGTTTDIISTVSAR